MADKNKHGEPTKRTWCLDCWARPENGAVVKPRKTWDIYPHHRGERHHMPTYCNQCWEQRKKYAPDEPPRNRPDGHEPTNEDRACIGCGARNLKKTATLGIPRCGACVYTCLDCKATFDDDTLEQYRWLPARENPNANVTCISCRNDTYDATDRVLRDSGDRLYRCPGCGYVEVAV